MARIPNFSESKKIVDGVCYNQNTSSSFKKSFGFSSIKKRTAPSLSAREFCILLSASDSFRTRIHDWVTKAHSQARDVFCYIGQAPLEVGAKVVFAHAHW